MITPPGKRICTDSPFGGRIICGQCGGFFGRKVWHSNSQYKRAIWRCNEKYRTKGKKECDLPHLDEETIKVAFVTALNRIFDCRDDVVNSLEIFINEALSGKKAATAIKKLHDELEVIELKTKALIDHNSKTVLNQEEYNRQYDALAEQYKTAVSEIEKLENNKTELAARKIRCMEFIQTLKAQPVALTEFDESLWNLLIQSVIVHKAHLEVIFKTGQTEKVAL